MIHSNYIYSLSNQLNALNPNLSKSINLIAIEDVSNIITQSKVKVIIFEERHIPNILKIANSKYTKIIRFICIGYELNSSDRLTLLNHNIEFITIDAYTQLNVSYFETNSNSTTYKVLIVEDDEDQILLTQHILINAKINVESVTKSKDVMNAIASFNPDLVLMDLYLDDINGDELVQIIRKNNDYKLLPIVFLTSDDTIETRMRVLNAGADDVLTKPINSELLVSALFNRMKRSHQTILTNQPENFITKDNISLEVNEVALQDNISLFFKDNIDNKSASIIWLKIDNKLLLQKDLGFMDFKNLCNFIFNNISSFYKNHSVLQKLTDGVYAIAFENSDLKQCHQMVNDIQNWFKRNHFSLNEHDYIVNVYAVILSDIPTNKNKELLIQSAEHILLEKQTISKSIELRERQSEEIHFDKIKTLLEASIKTRNFKWKYDPIISTKNNTAKIFQLDISVITDSGNELLINEYSDVAQKTGMLKLLNRFSFEHAIRIVRSREQDNKNTVVLVKQQLDDYKSLKIRSNILDVVKNLKLPYGAIIFDFSLEDAQQFLDKLGDIGRELKLANIKICLSEFTASKSAWDIARKLNTRWIKLKRFDENSQIMDSMSPNNLISIVSKARILCYEILVTDVSNKKFADKLKETEVGYLQIN